MRLDHLFGEDDGREGSMTSPSGITPRAVGERLAYAGIPDRVRRWVESILGSAVVEARGQAGACRRAARLGCVPPPERRRL